MTFPAAALALRNSPAPTGAHPVGTLSLGAGVRLARRTGLDAMLSVLRPAYGPAPASPRVSPSGSSMQMPAM